MKITRKQLKAILVEEIEKALAEGNGDARDARLQSPMAKARVENVYEQWKPSTPEGRALPASTWARLSASMHGKEPLQEEEKWAQDAAEDIEKKGTEGEFTKYCDGDVTQACVDKAAKGSSTKRKRQAAFAANVNSSDSLVYPKGKGKKD